MIRNDHPADVQGLANVPGSTARAAPATEALEPPRLWEKVEDRVRGLLLIKEDWDGAGASGVRQDLVESALHLAERLRQDGGSAPQDIYPLPDGNIIFEWQYTDGRIDRIEIEEPGQGQRMITFPDRPAEFSQLTWAP